MRGLLFYLPRVSQKIPWFQTSNAFTCHYRSMCIVQGLINVQLNSWFSVWPEWILCSNSSRIQSISLLNCLSATIHSLACFDNLIANETLDNHVLWRSITVFEFAQKRYVLVLVQLVSFPFSRRSSAQHAAWFYKQFLQISSRFYPEYIFLRCGLSNWAIALFNKTHEFFW